MKKLINIISNPWGPVILMAMLIGLFSTVSFGQFGTTAYSSLAANSFIVVHQPGGNTTGLLVSQLAPAATTQQGIQYKDEGSNLGASSTVTSVNFVGAGVTASRASNEVTVTIPVNDGIYTPTVVLGTDTLLNTYTFKYTVTDSVVHVSGKIRIGADAGTLIIAGTITLPPGITSNFTSVEDDVSGAVTVNQSDAITLGLSRLSARAYADTTNDLIGFSYEPIGTGGINRRNFVDFNLTITRK